MQPTVPKTPEAAARAFVAMVSKNDFDHAIGTFDPEMAKAMPPQKLADTWQELAKVTGAFQECGAAQSSAQGGYAVVVLSCKFEKQALDIKIALDSQLRVAGLFFLPSQPPYSPPAYAAKDAVEREITVGSTPWALPGTLTLPAGKGPFPAIVLVHGSGPGDRDETVGSNKPFKDIALGLAARGVAVLRFDKRTRVYAAQLKAALDNGNDKFTVDDESIDDAEAAVALLTKTPEIDAKRIFVFGHSLGGQLAPRIGARLPALAGIGILAGSTRPIGDMMLEQMHYIAGLDGKTSPEEDSQIKKIEIGAARVKEIVAGAKVKPGESIMGAPASYWIDLAGYDAPKVASKLTMPIFVAQGERDYQVTVVDYHNWDSALKKRPHVMMKLYPKLNHLMIAGEGKSVPEEYMVLGHVDEELINDIAAWVKKPK